MCNLVIRLQVSYQFPWRRSQSPLQVQQQGSLQRHLPQQHQPAPTQLNSTDAAVQQTAAQSASDQPSGSASFRQDDLSSATCVHVAEPEEESQQLATGHWRDHAHSMAAAPSHQQRLGSHWHRWPHHGGGAVQSPPQGACSLPRPDAESASTRHDGHRQTQLSTVTRPSSLWGFAASGVDLSHQPAAPGQAQLSELTWQGSATLGQAGASPDDDSLPIPDSLLHAISLSHPKSGSCRDASGQEITSDRDEIQQFEAQQAVQDEEDQWMVVNHDGRQEQQGRWGPAKIVRHIMTRARRAESRSRHGSVSAQTNLADAAGAST